MTARESYDEVPLGRALSLVDLLRTFGYSNFMSVSSRDIPSPRPVDLGELSQKRSDLEESVESPRQASLPVITLTGTTEEISKDVIDEVSRASLRALEICGVDMSPYQKGVSVGELVDLNAKDDSGFFTFPRRPGADKRILITLLSTQPVYNVDGREVIAQQVRGSSVSRINLGKLDDHFVGKAKALPQSTKAGAVAVEEALHHVQRNIWGKKIAHTSSLSPEEHVKDPSELEAARIKAKVLNELYPQIPWKILGVDY